MSFSYNHCTFVGRLTRAPEVKIVADNTARATLSLAVNRLYRKPDGTMDVDYISVVAWGKLGEIARQYLKKGSPILVEGRLQVRSYEKAGEQRWIAEVVAENFQMLGNYVSSSDSEEPEAGAAKTFSSTKRFEKRKATA